VRGAAGADGSVFSNSGRGGYLADGKGATRWNEKTIQEAINLGYSQERHRTPFFLPGLWRLWRSQECCHGPSSHSTSGNVALAAPALVEAAGGSFRLIADNGIHVLRNSGKIQCRGVLDGQNGGEWKF
jgi:hypothetical protein